MEGKDTELDKSILQAISDPITHLLRNAIDHGIEPVEDCQRLWHIAGGGQSSKVVFSIPRRERLRTQFFDKFIHA